MWPKPAYMDFHSQAKEIMREIAKKCHAEVLTTGSSKNRLSYPDPREVSDPNRRRFVISTPYLYSSVTYTAYNQPLPPGMLQKQIEDAIYASHDTLQYFRQIMNKVLNEGKGLQASINQVNNELISKNKMANTINVLGPGILYRYFTNNKDLPPNALEILSKDRFQMYESGFTSLKAKEMKSGLWQFDLFLTSTEFESIVTIMEKLVIAGKENERRKYFKIAWYELLKAHAGNLNDEELKNKSIGEVEQLMFGLPGTSEFLNLKLDDLEDKAKIDNIQLEKWVNLIKTKYDRLLEIKDNVNSAHTEFSFLPGNTRYFYIPQYLLP
jgi:hypothetical protein